MRFSIGVAAIIAVASLLAGGSPASAQERATADQNIVRIEVPRTNNLQFFTLWVAIGARYFEQEGLQPRILAAGGSRRTGELLFRGEADVAVLPPPMYLGMMAEQKPIALFASLLANEPINLVLQEDIAAARGFSARSSLRERLLALKGLRVGLAREVGPRLRALYASAGLDADQELRLVTVLGRDQVRTFAARDVDALFAHTPYLETVLVQHDAVLVVETSRGEVPVLADGQIHALATTRALAMSKPDTMVAVARAIHRAQRLIHSDAKAAVDAIIASGAATQDRPFVERFVAVYGPAVPATPAISLSGIERANTLYPAHPRHPDFSRVRLLDFVSPMIAERAIVTAR